MLARLGGGFNTKVLFQDINKVHAELEPLKLVPPFRITSVLLVTLMYLLYARCK
jgi:hypothetical protein